MWAACLVAFAILVFEAGVCPLIIAKVPCEFLLSTAHRLSQHLQLCLCHCEVKGCSLTWVQCDCPFSSIHTQTATVQMS